MNIVKLNSTADVILKGGSTSGGGGNTGGASGLFVWFIPSDSYASNYDLTEEELQAMIAHNAEVYKVLDSIFKNKGYVPNIDLVTFANMGSFYGRRTFSAESLSSYTFTEDVYLNEIGSYNIGDTVIKCEKGYTEGVERDIFDTLCPDGRFYYQRPSGGGPV